MQQQLFIPHLTHSQMFYSRQLGVWIFGLHVENDVRIVTLWTEVWVERGSTEVAGCLFSIFTTDIIKDVVKPDPRKLVLRSDNCRAQNKNQYILCMYMTLIAKGFFEEIVYKFPTCGHTFLSHDRDFAQVQKEEKNSSPQAPKDVIMLMSTAKEKNPFIIVDSPVFFYWKLLAHAALNTTSLKIFHVSELNLQLKSLDQWEHDSDTMDLHRRFETWSEKGLF